MPTYTTSNLVEGTVVSTDPEGKRTTNRITMVVPDFAIVTAQDITTQLMLFSDALQGLMHANVTSITYHVKTGVTYSLPTETGTFDSAEDKAILNFVDPVGSETIVQVPSPLSSIFLTGDNETVDPANTSVVTMGTALGAHTNGTPITAGGTVSFATRTGLAPAQYIRGYRKRVKTRTTFRPGISTELGGD